MELYKNLGFENNPFSTFSAEEEKSFLQDIYIKPRFFDTLKSDLIEGHSRFILGARGIGKTALILQLKNAVEEKKTFSLIIDEFDGIPLKNNETHLLYLIIQKIINQICLEVIGKNKSLLKKLNSSQKEKLSFIIKEFFKTTSKSQYEKIYNSTDHYKRRNVLRNIWNRILNRPINFLISGGIEIVADTVRKSMGLPITDGKDFYKNYLPELSLEQIQKESNADKFLSNYGALKTILEDLSELIKALGYNTTVVFFDKIDEYTKLGGNVSAVAGFLAGILQDTTVLMHKHYSLVFSLWDVLKQDLNNAGVRFDKIKPVDITWQSDDLKNILEKRIAFFSKNRRSTSNIFEDQTRLDAIISLSNNSPRYLFRQLSYIYDNQSELNPNVTVLSNKALYNGQEAYCLAFDYYTLNPTKRGSKEDILKNVNRLLKIGKHEIRTNDFADVYKVSVPTAISYIKIVQDYNLVKELPETQGQGGAKIYKVQDPVINHLIKIGVTELKL